VRPHTQMLKWKLKRNWDEKLNRITLNSLTSHSTSLCIAIKMKLNLKIILMKFYFYKIFTIGWNPFGQKCMSAWNL
jgi:hypothetical protein